MWVNPPEGKRQIVGCNRTMKRIPYILLLLFISCSSESERINPSIEVFNKRFDSSKYVLRNYGSFSIQIPVSWDNILTFGYDSQVKRFKTPDGDTIHIEFGYYTNQLPNGRWCKIGKEYAKIVTSDTGNGINGAYIPKIMKINNRYCHFNIYGQNLKQNSIDQLFSSISTLKFNNQYDLYHSR